jgi:hypothetical protein
VTARLQNESRQHRRRGPHLQQVGDDREAVAPVEGRLRRRIAAFSASDAALIRGMSTWRSQRPSAAIAAMMPASSLESGKSATDAAADVPITQT